MVYKRNPNAFWFDDYTDLVEEYSPVREDSKNKSDTLEVLKYNMSEIGWGKSFWTWLIWLKSPRINNPAQPSCIVIEGCQPIEIINI